MAEDLLFDKTQTKAKRYAEAIGSLRALLAGERDLVANLANAAALLRQAFGWFWVGFYVLKNDELVLGPFQGPVACTRIAPGRGVCGTAAVQRKTVVVPDVDAFPGHIACNSASKSEIVVPLIKNGELVGVLDVDSNELDAFDEADRENLEKVAELIIGATDF